MNAAAQVAKLVDAFRKLYRNTPLQTDANLSVLALGIMDEKGVTVARGAAGVFKVLGSFTAASSVAVTGAVTCDSLTVANAVTIGSTVTLTGMTLMLTGISGVNLDPHVAGQVWLNSGVMTVSSG